MEHYYQRWMDDEEVRKFADKTVDRFFESEAHFLERIGSRVSSVLDVGCAGGRLIELLCRYLPQGFSYTGLDLSVPSVEIARRDYPDRRFLLGNALDIEFDDQADLVNATGVLQHEPRFEELIERMIGWSSRYVLFDVKIADIDDHLVDLERAYYKFDHPLYLVVLSREKLKGFLGGLRGVARSEVFSYATPKNPKMVAPETVGEVISAGILLDKKADGPLIA